MKLMKWRIAERKLKFASKIMNRDNSNITKRVMMCEVLEGINELPIECKILVEEIGLANVVTPRSCKRSKTLFKSLLFWLAGEVSWLAVEVLSPCRK